MVTTAKTEHSEATASASGAEAIGPALQWEIERFLYDEAALLDDGRLEDWLELFTPEATYRAPVTETRDPGEAFDPLAPGRLAIFEEERSFLEKRVARLKTAYAHAEQPRSRTRHFVSNIRIIDASATEVMVRANFLVFQSRREDSESFFVGERRDILVRGDGGWRIRARTILFDQRLLPRALSILF